MTCGAPQGSRVGPHVWDVMYDDFVRLHLPDGTSIISLVDDAHVVCATEDVTVLELRINGNLWCAKRWLENRGLKMAPEKTEVLLVTDRRSFQYPRIVLGDPIATAKAIQCGANLARLIPNIGGPREAKRRLVESVVHSKLHHAASCTSSGLVPYKTMLSREDCSQRREVLR